MNTAKPDWSIAVLTALDHDLSFAANAHAGDDDIAVEIATIRNCLHNLRCDRSRYDERRFRAEAATLRDRIDWLLGPIDKRPAPNILDLGSNHAHDAVAAISRSRKAPSV